MEMFKHVLIPTNGSPLSRKAIKAGIAFAKRTGAKVMAYSATEVVPVYSGSGFILPSVLEQFETGALKRAQKRKGISRKLRRLRKRRAFHASRQIPRRRWSISIIDAAKKNKCDVVFMASHGRGEVASAVLGSVTLNVLSHSKIPVMVFR